MSWMSLKTRKTKSFFRNIGRRSIISRNYSSTINDRDECPLTLCSQQRLQELSNLQRNSIHNQVYPLQKPDYSRDVTEASSKYFVCVLLTSSLGTNIESTLLTQHWRQLAQKYGEVKFCEMRADLCIEGYPERNTPTILIYRNGDIVKQVITLREMNGTATKFDQLEKMLVDVKAIADNDLRLRESDRLKAEEQKNNPPAGEADDDEDWD